MVKTMRIATGIDEEKYEDGKQRDPAKSPSEDEPEKPEYEMAALEIGKPKNARGAKGKPRENSLGLLVNFRYGRWLCGHFADTDCPGVFVPVPWPYPILRRPFLDTFEFTPPDRARLRTFLYTS